MRFIDSHLRKIDTADRLLILMMVIGAVVTGSSLFRGITAGDQVQIEYLNSETGRIGEVSEVIYVDIEGAVISPGVYEITKGSRMKDVLIRAGGYSELADRDYCEKTLNLAQVVSDGQKIYIPEMGNTPVPQGYSEAKSSALLVNINTSSLKELDTLWGVGPARAEEIVKNRPYENLEELVSKKVVSKQVLERNRGSLTVY